MKYQANEHEETHRLLPSRISSLGRVRMQIYLFHPVILFLYIIANAKADYHPGPVVYCVADDELIEDHNLQIIGETDPREFSDDGNGNENQDIPVRQLNDFVIYNLATNEVVSVAELTQIRYSPSTDYGSSGLVEPWVDDEDGDQEDITEAGEDPSPGQRVKLSKLIEFDVHHFSDRKRKLDRYASSCATHMVIIKIAALSNIYIRTEFAWYILDTPSSTYSPFFSSFWIQHRILHLIVSRSLTESRVTYPDFVDSLKVTPETPDSIAISVKIIGRELTEADVESDEVVSAEDFVRLVYLIFSSRNPTSLSLLTTCRTKRILESIVSLLFVPSEVPTPTGTKDILKARRRRRGERKGHICSIRKRTCLCTETRPSLHPVSARLPNDYLNKFLRSLGKCQPKMMTPATIGLRGT